MVNNDDKNLRYTTIKTNKERKEMKKKTKKLKKKLIEKRLETDTELETIQKYRLYDISVFILLKWLFEL